ncbi:MAG TPA: carboxypeptidase-like regulatory domain-containing protein [Thermoanaerobaculia bacterium]|nr:carboxypeptidase-like regulatory domain-containing protein [Thermoanaerobaculia bacterium]
MIALLLIAAITGNVIGPDGAPIAKTRVTAYRAERLIDRLRRESAKKERPLLGAATTGDDGAFKLDTTDGIVDVHVESDGFRADPVLVPADEHDITIALQKGAPPAEQHVFSYTNRPPELFVDAGARASRPQSLAVPADDRDAKQITHSPTPAASAGIAVQGKVIDANGKPVANASVLSEEHLFATTDDEGRFAIAHVSRGGLIEVISERGSGFAEARPGELTIRVHPQQKITGVVRDEAKKPVAGVPIYAIEGDMVIGPETLGGAVSDAKGAFTLNVADARYPITANAGPYVQAVIGSNEDVTIKRLATVDGVVRDADDKPVGGAGVIFALDIAVGWDAVNAMVHSSVTTDAHGRFRTHVPAGAKGRIEVSPRGRPTGNSETMTVPAAGKRDVVVRLRPGIEVRGVVRDGRGQPLGGVSIRKPTDGEWAMTADDGSFSVELEQGSSALVFTKKHYVETTKEFDVKPSIEPLHITLSDAAIVRGTLMRKDGEAARETLMAVGSEALAAVNPDGTFELEFAAPGTYTIETMGSSHKFVVHAPSSDVRLVLDPGLLIRGRVVDAMTGEPIEQFIAQAWRGDESLDAPADDNGAGEFVISGLAPGRITVIAGGEHYLPSKVSAEAGQSEPVTIALNRGFTLRGRVHDADGQPIEDVHVEFEQRPAETRAYPTTEADGTFELDALEPDENVKLTFSRNGWLQRMQQIRVTSDMMPLDVVLSRGMAAKGHVLDRSGKPVEGIPVTATSAAFGASYANAATDSSGAFTMAALAPGRYDFTVHDRRAGVRGATRDVDIEQVHDVVIRVEPQQSGAIAGKVSGIKPTATIRSLSIDTSAGKVDTQIQPDGTFHADDVPAGIATVCAYTSSGGTMRSTRRVTVDVAPGAVANVELQVEEQRTLRGRVTRNGRPAAHAEVMLQSQYSSADAITTDDGSYELHLDAGRYHVLIAGLPYSGDVDVEQTSVLDIEIDTFTTRALVIDGDSSAPIPDVTIHARDLRAVTGADGRASIDVPRGAAVTLIASKNGYANASAEAIDGDIVMRLVRSAGVVVRIVDARDGRTLTGNAVARDAAGHVLASAHETEPDGTYVLPLAAGEYRFSASASGYGSETVRASVPPGEVHIALPRGGQLLLRSNQDVHGTARLLLPDGDMYVRCWCNGVADIEIDGRLTTVDAVSPGSYTLEVTPLGGRPRRYPVTVVQGETVAVQID